MNQKHQTEKLFLALFYVQLNPLSLNRAETKIDWNQNLIARTKLAYFISRSYFIEILVKFNRNIVHYQSQPASKKDFFT